jgi:hypothetical protein
MPPERPNRLYAPAARPANLLRRLTRGAAEQVRLRCLRIECICRLAALELRDLERGRR